MMTTDKFEHWATYTYITSSKFTRGTELISSWYVYTQFELNPSLNIIEAGEQLYTHDWTPATSRQHCWEVGTKQVPNKERTTISVFLRAHLGKLSLLCFRHIIRAFFTNEVTGQKLLAQLFEQYQHTGVVTKTVKHRLLSRKNYPKFP